MKRVRFFGFLAVFFLCTLALLPQMIRAANLAAPRSLRASARSSSTISVTWRAVNGAAEYRVYSNRSAEGTFKHVGTTRSTQFTLSHLTSSSPYHIKVRAVDSSGKAGPFSGVDRATTERGGAAPASLNAKAVSHTQLTLGWPAVKGATAYCIYRYDSTAKAYVYLAKTITTAYTNKSLKPNTRYSYKVRALSSRGEGLFSPAGAATTKPTPALTVKAKSSSAVVATWPAKTGAVSYMVYRCNTADGVYRLVGRTTSTRYTIYHLPPSSTCYVKVRAVYASGTAGAACKPARTTTKSGGVAPVSLAVSALSTTRLQLRWTAVNGATAYCVYRYNAANKAYTYLAQTKDAAYVDTGLAAGTRYSYKVRAVTDGEGLFSPAVSANTQSAAPIGLSGEPAGFRSIKLTWKPSAGASQYRLYRAASVSGSYATVATIAATSYTDGNLAEGTTYYYKISAVSSSGEGPTGKAVAAASEIPYAAPTGVWTKERRIDSVTLAWNAAENATGYRVYRIDPATETYYYVGQTEAMQFVCKGLPADSEVNFQLATVGRFGAGPLGAVYSTRTAAPLPAPDGLSADSEGSVSSILLRWNPVTGATGYRVYQRTGSTITFRLAGTTDGATQFLCSGLSPSTSYQFIVAAVNGAGEGHASALVSAKTDPLLAVPTGFAAEQITWSGYTLRWNGVERVQYYVLEQALSASGPFTPVLMTNETNHRITGLLPGDIRYYRVIAHNAFSISQSPPLPVSALTIPQGRDALRNRISSDAAIVGSRIAAIEALLVKYVEQGIGNSNECDQLRAELDTCRTVHSRLYEMYLWVDDAQDAAALDALLEQAETAMAQYWAR